MALVCGLFIAHLYKVTYRGTSYSTSYVQSLVAFAMITAVVIMVIGNNLARAFGLVGSMSIVRFRMAIKDTADIVFIFFALGIGMAAGVGAHMVGVVATIYIGAMIYILSKVNFARPHKREYLLQFTYTSEDEHEAPYLATLKKFCKRYKLVNVKSLTEESIEVSYYIVPKKKELAKEFISSLNKLEGVSQTNLFFDEA